MREPVGNVQELPSIFEEEHDVIFVKCDLIKLPAHNRSKIPNVLKACYHVPPLGSYDI